MSTWPDGPLPVINEIQVAHIERQGRSVAVVRLTDALGNAREVDLTVRAAWSAMVGFTHFLRQLHHHTTSTHPCRHCDQLFDEHPHPACPAWS